MHSLTMRSVMLILQTFVPTVLSYTCYTPAGQDIADNMYNAASASDYFPCNTDANVPSTCCSYNQTCSNDNLCEDSQGYAYRTFCTLSTWDTPFCSRLCNDQGRDSYTVLTQCDDGSYCCFFNNTDCCDAGNGVKINAQGQILLSNGQVSALPTTVLEFSTAMMSTSTSTSSQIPTSSSAQVTASVSPSASSSPSSKPNSGGSTSIGAIVGGVIGGIAVIILAIIAYLLYRRNKLKRQDPNPQPPDMSQQHSRQRWVPGGLPSYGLPDTSRHSYYAPTDTKATPTVEQSHSGRTLVDSASTAPASGVGTRQYEMP